MFNLGKMKIAAIQLYGDFMERVAAEEERGYRRYRGLLNFLGGIPGGDAESGPIEKMGAEGDDYKEQYEREKERGRGKARVSDTYAQWFGDMLEDFLPGGYFSDPKKTRGMYGDEDVHALVKKFHKMAHDGFESLLPKLLSKKLNADEHMDFAPSEIVFDDELINDTVTDAIKYFQGHPEEIQKGLVRAYSTKFKSEGDEESKELGVAQAFFRPRVDDAYFSELLKKSEATGEEPELRRGAVDSGVLKNLESAATSRRPVKWRWVSIDENGMLTFTMPELYGDRKFIIRLPRDIGTIRPGEYSMVVRRVSRSGAVVEFADQKQQIQRRYLDQVREQGLGADQLESFIDNGFINQYVTVLTSKPLSTLIDDFSGHIVVSGRSIETVDDLAGLAGSGGKEIPKARGSEKIEKVRSELQQELDSKTKRVGQRWRAAPALQKMFLTMEPTESDRIVSAVASRYPEESEKGTISLDSILATRPVVHFIMETILNPTTPLSGGGKSDPWVTITINHIRRDAVRDPILLRQFTELMRVSGSRAEAKKKTPSISKVITPRGTPVSTRESAETSGAPAQEIPIAEVKSFINSIPETVFRTALFRLKKDLQDTIMSLRGVEPVLDKFFQRKDAFQSYLVGVVLPFVRELLYISTLDPDDEYRVKQSKKLGIIKPDDIPIIDSETTEGQEIVDRQIKAFIGRAVKKMEQPGLSMTASTLDPAILQRLMVRAYHLVTTGQSLV